MKKSATAILIFAFFSVALKAQMEVSEMMIPNHKSTYKRLGFSMPTWMYFGANGQDDFDDAIRRAGFIAEVGKLKEFKFLSYDHFKAGLNTDFIGFSSNLFWKKDDGTTEGSRIYITSNYIYSNIGPFISLYTNRNIAFDFYVKYCLNWLAHTQIFYLNDLSENNWENPYSAFLASKISLGFNIRISNLILGMEGKFGQIKFTYENNGDIFYFGDFHGNSNLTPVPEINFTLGHVITKARKKKKAY
jgi:hypothetical protein